MASNMLVSLLRIAGFSALAGARSMSPPAELGLFLASRQQARPALVATLALLASGELVGDKLPQTPNRTAPPLLIFRGLSGAVLGWVLARRDNQQPWLGGVAGGAAALAGTFASFYLRRWLTQTLPGKQATLAAALSEDALVWLAGWLLLRSGAAGEPQE